MSNPKRLLDPEGEGTAEERELVEAARGRAVPASVKAAIWTAVVAQGAGMAASASASAAAAAGSAAKGGALAVLSSWKSIAVLVVLGAGAATSVQLLRPSSAPPAQHAPAVAPAGRPGGEIMRPATAPSPASSPNPAAVAQPPLPAASRPTERSRPARPSSPSIVAPVPLPPSRLAEEAQNLVEARRLLRSGATTAALSALEQGSREFAGGRLEQEREALFIEALAQSGQTELARRRATVFLRNHPGSPHAADVKRHVDVQ